MRRTRLPLVSLNSKVRSDSTANICKSNVKQSVNSAVMYHVGKKCVAVFYIKLSIGSCGVCANIYGRFEHFFIVKNISGLQVWASGVASLQHAVLFAEVKSIFPLVSRSRENNIWIFTETDVVVYKRWWNSFIWDVRAFKRVVSGLEEVKTLDCVTHQ